MSSLAGGSTLVGDKISSRHSQRDPSVHFPHPPSKGAFASASFAHAHSPFSPHDLQPTGTLDGSVGEMIWEIENVCDEPTAVTDPPWFPEGGESRARRALSPIEGGIVYPFGREEDTPHEPSLLAGAVVVDGDDDEFAEFHLRLIDSISASRLERSSRSLSSILSNTRYRDLNVWSSISRPCALSRNSLSTVSCFSRCSSSCSSSSPTRAALRSRKALWAALF